MTSPVLLDVITRGPAEDVALGPLLLRRGHSDATEILRIYSPEPTAAFSRRDTLRPGYRAAAESAREHGFAPVVRPQGGRLAAYHRGSVVVDHIFRGPNPQAGLVDRFRQFAALHAAMLVELGVDARVGEVPGEYCPGEFSVNVAGTSKIVGSAQRVTRDGWLMSSVFQVTGTAATRGVLTAAYRDLGYDFDPATVGSIEDFVPGFTVQTAAEALRNSYAGAGAVEVSDLDGALLGELRSKDRHEQRGQQEGDDVT